MTYIVQTYTKVWETELWSDLISFEREDDAVAYIKRNRECTVDEMRVVEVLYGPE